MKTQDSTDNFYAMARNPDFEKLVNEAAEKAILEMDKVVANEIKLRYITHIFSKTLDNISEWLIKPKYLN